MSGHERERLSAYLDRELPADERAAVEAHLAACPECATRLAELAAADEAAACLPAEAPESYFEAFPARVRARLESARTASPGRRVPAWTWAVAAVLLLAVVTPLTLRELRPAAREAPPAAPAAVQPTPAAAEPRVVAGLKRSVPAPTAPPSRPAAPAGAATPAPVPPAAPQENEVAGFAREPGPPRAAQALATRAEAAAPPPAAVAKDGLSARGGEPRHVAAADAGAAAPEAPTLPAEKARLAGATSAERPLADGFRRLEAVRPRSAAEWRRLRDEWNALAAAQADPLRADEARVRAIEAGREAWRRGADASDEDAFRRDAAAYLERADALQKPRVERLLAEAGPGRTP